MHLSKKFHLVGFIAAVYELGNRPEHEELNSLRNFFIAKNLMMSHDMNLICSELNEKQINYCILKGPALNKSKVYKPNIRFFRDIDILVAKEDLNLAFKSLNNLGYKYVNKFARNSCEFFGNHHHLPVMENQNGTFVELHHRATATRHYRECPITNKILEERIFFKNTFIPCPEALLGHILYHGIVQHRHSIGPIILFDIKQIMNKHNLKHHAYNKYVSMLKLDVEFGKVCKLLSDIEKKEEIHDFNQRLNNIRQNLALAETESARTNISQILPKINDNFLFKKIVSTEFNYQISRLSPIFPFFYFKELFKSIKNIRLF